MVRTILSAGLNATEGRYTTATVQLFAVGAFSKFYSAILNITYSNVVEKEALILVNQVIEQGTNVDINTVKNQLNGKRFTRNNIGNCFNSYVYFLDKAKKKS